MSSKKDKKRSNTDWEKIISLTTAIVKLIIQILILLKIFTDIGLL